MTVLNTNSQHKFTSKATSSTATEPLHATGRKGGCGELVAALCLHNPHTPPQPPPTTPTRARRERVWP